MPVPPQVPLIKFLSPNKADQGILEFWNTTQKSYLPLDLNVPHPNTREYLGYKLGKQFNLPTDEKWIVRVWITAQTDPTWWAWSEKFSGDANAFPVFIREYREARKTYAPLTKGQPLKSVYKVSLTAAGSAYVPGKFPALAFAGGAGSGAAGHAIVNQDGTLADLVLDDGGDGYTSAPTFTVEAPPAGGTTATGTALIQPTTALLVSEEAQQFPDDSEFFGLYLNVVRVYETLPGPDIPFTRYDENLGPIQGKKRAVLNTNQVTTLGATSKKTYEGRDGSSIVSWEIEEDWSDGTGGAGNPAYPEKTSTDFEKDGVEKITTKQLMAVGNVVTDEDLTGGTLTRQFKEAYPDNPALAFQIVETITVSDSSLLDLPSFTTSILNLIPEIFRGQIPLHVRSHIIAGTAAETALVTGEFEHSERQLTPLYMEVRSTVLDSIGSLPIAITGIKETNDKKQVVSVTMTLEADTTTPTTPTEVRDVDFKKLGNGLAIEVVRTVPDVFPEDSYTKSILNLIPEKLRGTIPTTESTVDSAGSPSTDPTLLTGELSRTEGRVTAYTKRVRITKLGTISLPAVITGGKESNDKKQVVSVVYTLEVDSTTPTAPNEVRDVEFVKLGNGLAVETVRTIPDVFPEDSYTTSIENLIPAKLRGLIQLSESTVDSAGSPSTNPTLLTGELSRTEGRVTAYTKRVRITSLGEISVPVSVFDTETNDQKQIVAVIHTLDVSGSLADIPTALIDVSAIDLGNGYEVQTLRTISDIFDPATFTTSIPNLIPEKLRALIATHTESHFEEGTASEPSLSTGEFSRSERQINEFVKEVRFEVLDDIGSLPISITGEKETNQYKQVVSVGMKLCVDSTPPTAVTALIDVDFKKLGNGLAVEVTKTIPGVFDKDTRSIEIPDVAPAWVKAQIPTTNASSEAAATSVSDPTLSTGQLRKTVQRTTEKTVETQTTTRDAASLPKSRTNKRLTTEFGGGAVDEVQTQATGSQSISSGGLLVLDSEMEVLGNGTSVLKTSTQTDGSWPVLYDYDIDPETGQTILTSYQVVASSSAATATVSSGVITKYKHIDKWRSLKIIETYSTPADYDEQRFGAHNFPTLWDGVYGWSTECGAFATGFRGGFSTMVRMRTTVSFSTSKAADIDGLTLIPKTLLMGKGVQLPSDLIMDSGSFIYSGTCSGTASFGASDPDYSTYTGSIQGTEQLITGESVKMQRSGLYRTTSVYVYML